MECQSQTTTAQLASGHQQQTMDTKDNSQRPAAVDCIWLYWTAPKVNEFESDAAIKKKNHEAQSWFPG